MVNTLIRWCLNNRFLVLLFTVVVIGAGWYCLVNTPVDAFDDRSDIVHETIDTLREALTEEALG